jgi:hypothetical protein
MENATITKIKEQIAECNEDYSLGFKRYMFLPCLVQKNMQLAHLFLGNGTSALTAIKTFLLGLTDNEYSLWLQQQKE